MDGREPLNLLVIGAGPVGLACGVVAAGVDIGRLFIENGRLHAVRIVRRILKTSGRPPAEPLGAPSIRQFQDGDYRVPLWRIRGRGRRSLIEAAR